MKTDPPSSATRLPPGTRCIVAECSGLASGQHVTVSRPFFWRHAEDGTYAPPGARQVPIRYGNGRRGFMFINRLRPVAKDARDVLSPAANPFTSETLEGDKAC